LTRPHTPENALASNLLAAHAVASLLGGLLSVALAWEAPAARRPPERARPAVAHGVTVALA
jgi:hypothetical protein